MKHRRIGKKVFKRKISEILACFLICITLTGCTERNRTPENNLNKEQESPVNPEIMTGQVTEPGNRTEIKVEKETEEITEEREEQEIKNAVQIDTVLESPPNMQLSDTLSSMFNIFSVSSGNYNWNYRKNSDEMVGIIACGNHPLDLNVEQVEALKIPHYNGTEEVLYVCNFEVQPDRISVTEYDSSKIETTQKVQEITTEYEDSSFINLKSGKIYYITAWWEQDFLENRGFYGQASYQVLTN